MVLFPLVLVLRWREKDLGLECLPGTCLQEGVIDPLNNYRVAPPVELCISTCDAFEPKITRLPMHNLQLLLSGHEFLKLECPVNDALPFFDQSQINVLALRSTRLWVSHCGCPGKEADYIQR